MTDQDRDRRGPLARTGSAMTLPVKTETII